MVMITDTLSYVEFCKANLLWETRRGESTASAPAFDPAEPMLVRFRGQMAPRTVAKEHPVALLLREYATKGCPTECKRNWKIVEMQAAIE